MVARTMQLIELASKQIRIRPHADSLKAEDTSSNHECIGAAAYDVSFQIHTDSQNGALLELQQRKRVIAERLLHRVNGY